MELTGCSNPGFTYTENTINNIMELIEWLNDNKESDLMTYKEMQISVEMRGGNLKGSAIRMLIPFFRKAGLIKDEPFAQHNNKIDFSDVFTDLGTCFFQFVRIYTTLKEIDDIEIQNQLAKIYEEFGVIQYSHLIIKSEKVYGGIILFLKKYETMDKNEFFMLTTILDLDETPVVSQKLDDMVSLYREKVIKESEIKITKNANAYGYIVPFLQSYNILCKCSEGNRLNQKYEHRFDEILEEDYKND